MAQPRTNGHFNILVVIDERPNLNAVKAEIIVTFNGVKAKGKGCSIATACLGKLLLASQPVSEMM